MKLTHLRTNHLENPVGIDTNPEFSWRIESDEKDVKQIAYSIVVLEDFLPVWKSGRIESEQQSFVHFEGIISSRVKYRWDVTVWDNKGNEATESAYFETGFLSDDDWEASWVESTIDRYPVEPYSFSPSNNIIAFEREFRVNIDAVSAKIYCACFGASRIYVNSSLVHNTDFAPGYTSYDKVLNYQVYDITPYIETGMNYLEILVGDGWYFCPTLEMNMKADQRQEHAAVRFQIEIEYSYGEKRVICSSDLENCRATNNINGDIFMGEKVDFTDLFGSVKETRERKYSKVPSYAQQSPYTRCIEVIPAVDVFTTPKGETIVDFGQVINGKIRALLCAKNGDEIVFEYSQVLDEDGNFIHTSPATQTDFITSNGKPYNYTQYFTYHSFRYVKVTGMERVEKENFTAHLLSSEKENAGDFVCDNEDFNQLYKNIRYSQKNNTMSIPTDNPLYGKVGRSANVSAYAETAMLNEDMTAFFSNWIQSVAASQRDDGSMPAVSPSTIYSDENDKGFVHDAIISVPYDMYQVTGNTLILDKYFNEMNRFCDYLITIESDDKFQSLMRVLCLEKFVTICKVLGDEHEKYIEKIEEYRNEIASDIEENGFDGTWDVNNYIIALNNDFVPESRKEEAKNNFLALYETNYPNVTAAARVLDLLEKIGSHELAKSALYSRKKYSWLTQVEKGATTIWEHPTIIDKDGNEIIRSYDSLGYGSVDSFIFHKVCGISGDVGYKNITIAPNMNYGFDSFTRKFICEAGEICVCVDGDSLKVTIPCNTTAKVVWKGNEYNIGSGEYQF